MWIRLSILVSFGVLEGEITEPPSTPGKQTDLCYSHHQMATEKQSRWACQHPGHPRISPTVWMQLHSWAHPCWHWCSSGLYLFHICSSWCFSCYFISAAVRITEFSNISTTAFQTGWKPCLHSDEMSQPVLNEHLIFQSVLPKKSMVKFSQAAQILKSR